MNLQLAYRIVQLPKNNLSNSLIYVSVDAVLKHSYLFNPFVRSYFIHM